MGMWYYQFESCLETYLKILEEREKASGNNDNQDNLSNIQRQYSPSNIMKQVKGMMPKMPNFSIPKL